MSGPSNAVLRFARDHRKGLALGLQVLVVVLVFLALVVSDDLRVDLDVRQGRGQSGSQRSYSSRIPAEFLYLDAGRADSYLAQIEGGALEDGKVTSKVKSSLKATLQVAKVIEGGASEEQEEGEEWEVKPTDASRFLALREALREAGELAHPLAKTEEGMAKVSEGEFVEFSRPQIFMPAYLTPYLVSRGAATLRAAFGKRRSRRGGRERFLRRVGKEPRAVLVLRPRGKGIYLMPIEAQLLSAERSLFSEGSGRLTVVGKVVRTFPESGDEKQPAYKDLAAREEWEPALKSAPDSLIRRSAERCVEAIRARCGRWQPGRAARRARRRDLRTLQRDTVIRTDGAVIVPVAIYK